METNMDYEAARGMLVKLAVPVDAQKTDLEHSQNRILAEELRACQDVPAFDRSPYDGYAFRAKDSLGAAKDHPVTLKVLEEVPAGAVPTVKVTEGTATKILTGAPIPDGADAVVMYEKTSFTDEFVTLYCEAGSGDNIIYAGEDVKKGSILAQAGSVIDAGIAGTLASQGKVNPSVYRKPVAGIISTGSELTDIEADFDPAQLAAGKILNTNRYSLAAALQKDGCETLYLGSAGDDAEKIAELIKEGLGINKEKACDIVFLTGGVSAGDYDLTPDAMRLAGCGILAKGVMIKPGMACCYGIYDKKLVCALSGNPASSIINYYSVVRPAVRKLTGMRDYMPAEFNVKLAEGFGKKSRTVRFLKGNLEISSDGTALMHMPKEQGNVMLSSTIGCNCIAVVPENSGPLEAGQILKGFFI